MEGHEAATGLASLPVELVGMIVNGRDRHGHAFLDPRWRCMTRMASWPLRQAVENPAPRDAKGLGDPQTLFRRPMVDAGDCYVELDTPHARRTRWRRGAIVCASAVAEWVRALPEQLTRDRLDALVDHMVVEWGASRATAHMVMLAADRPDTVAYALDPAISAPFARVPAVPDHPDDFNMPAYDRLWHPDGQTLVYAMMDVAVRRCARAAVQAALSAIKAAPWVLYVHHQGSVSDDDDDYDRPGSDERLGLHRMSLFESIFAFDRDDVMTMIGLDLNTISDGLMLDYGAARCLAAHMPARDASGASAASMRRLSDTFMRWGRGDHTHAMGQCLSAAPALRAIPKDMLGPRHIKSILLGAIHGGDIDAALWALTASGYAHASARALLSVSGLTATGLMRHALTPYSNSRKTRLRTGIGRYAGAARSAAWLCDVLGYDPTDDDLSELAAACVERHHTSYPCCCVARAIFLLERWPLAMWSTRTGVRLVRDAFAWCMSGQSLARDAIDLFDAVEAWCVAVSVERTHMRDTLALLCSAASRGGSMACIKSILLALNGQEWTRACMSVCYGTCRAASSDPTAAPFCNGRDRSDADKIVAWCLPNFSATRCCV
nr:hypothetical protein [Pandoravirus massiliensis]